MATTFNDWKGRTWTVKTESGNSKVNSVTDPCELTFSDGSGTPSISCEKDNNPAYPSHHCHVSEFVCDPYDGANDKVTGMIDAVSRQVFVIQRSTPGGGKAQLDCAILNATRPRPTPVFPRRGREPQRGDDEHGSGSGSWTAEDGSGLTLVERSGSGYRAEAARGVGAAP